MKDIFFQSNRLNTFYVLLFLVAFSIPFSYVFNSVLLFVFFLYSFLFFNKKQFFKNITLKEVYIFYFILFFVQIFSIFYAEDKNLAKNIVLKNILFLILPIAFINLKSKISEGAFKAVFLGLLSAITMNLVVIYFSLFKKFIEDSSANLFRENFVDKGIFPIHVPYLSMLIVFLILISYDVNLFSNKRLDKIVKIVLTIILFVALIQLSGVTSVIILLLFVILKIVKNSKNIRIQFFVIFGAILLSVSYFYIKKNHRLERVVGGENLIYRVQKLIDNGDSVRLENWESVMKVIKNNFFLGVGADGGMQQLLKKRRPLSEPYINKHNAHNIYLEVLLRYGFIGLSAFGVILFFLIRKAIKDENQYFKSFLFVFLIAGFTESLLQRQIGLVFFIFFSLFFYTFRNNVKKESKNYMN